MRSRRFTIKKSNDATQRNSSAQRRLVAVESDRPNPVQSVTCAARQAGHLGTNTRTALGRAQAKISRTLRTHGGAFRSLAASQQALILVSPSDSCVGPARECAPASAASLRAIRRDVRAGSTQSRGGG